MKETNAETDAKRTMRILSHDMSEELKTIALKYFAMMKTLDVPADDAAMTMLSEFGWVGSNALLICTRKHNKKKELKKLFRGVLDSCFDGAWKNCERGILGREQ